MTVEVKVDWVKGFKVRRDEKQSCIHLEQTSIHTCYGKLFKAPLLFLY